MSFKKLKKEKYSLYVNLRSNVLKYFNLSILKQTFRMLKYEVFAPFYKEFIFRIFARKKTILKNKNVIYQYPCYY